MKISDLLSSSSSTSLLFSLEFFPPKTDAGIENLYLRIERMSSLNPLFVDITMGAGGSTKELTLTIASHIQVYLGVPVLMHLTCASMTCDDIRKVLNAAKEAGITNILALRGDPLRGAAGWQSIDGGLDHAIDLVKLIRKEYNDYFCIAVAGFPEGHPQGKLDLDTEIKYLKEKVDAGADFVMTQFFYDTSVFINFSSKCKANGITCPIIPGMMPIQNFSSFQKMTQYCRTKVPSQIWDDLLPIKEDDEAVKAYGIKLCTEMCNALKENGILIYHFYTLNLEKSVLGVLKEIGIEDTVVNRKALPWRGSRSNLSGLVEDVRPINWANRPKSYIRRTGTWDDFPNGRWGDGRSPAFGDLASSHFFRPVGGTKEDRLAMWGESPITCEEIYNVFAMYLEAKIPVTPWCETPLHAETTSISTTLIELNRAGFMTINSQPAVNGEKSDNPVYGWGGSNGRVYQKAYVEFFASPDNFETMREIIDKSYPDLRYYVINSSGETNYPPNDSKGVTALTWGVFPDREILQPTIFDPDTFTVWSEEAFQLWTSAWASLYDDETESSALLYEIHDTYKLIAIIDNDFIEPKLFSLFTDIIQAYKGVQS